MNSPPLPPITTRAEAYRLGWKLFYPGEPCKRGHLAARYVSNGGCTACMGKFKVGGARNPYDERLTPYEPAGIWRPNHWDAHTLAQCDAAVQAFVDDWAARHAPLPPRPAPPRLVYGRACAPTGTATSVDGEPFELWRAPAAAQVHLREGRAAGGGTVALFTDEGLREADWVYRNIGDGPVWYVCEHVDYALYPVIRPEALDTAARAFGLDGSIKKLLNNP